MPEQHAAPRPIAHDVATLYILRRHGCNIPLWARGAARARRYNGMRGRPIPLRPVLELLGERRPSHDLPTKARTHGIHPVAALVAAAVAESQHSGRSCSEYTRKSSSADSSDAEARATSRRRQHLQAQL
jgi:hypothetical protein